jgi:hypothetical protein
MDDKTEQWASLQYVSSVYISSQLTSKDNSLHETFLLNCGAVKGIVLIASLRAITDNEIKLLPQSVLPKLRQTKTSCDLNLPFNLGILDKRHVEVVDVSITPVSIIYTNLFVY